MEEQTTNEQKPQKDEGIKAKLNPENTSAQIALAHGQKVEPNRQLEEESQEEETQRRT